MVSGTLLIILALTVSFWFVLKEYPVTFGIIVPTCVLRRRVFKTLVVSSIAAGAALATMSAEPASLSSSPLTCSLAAVSTIITILAAELMGIPSSAAAAMHGAIAAVMLSSS
ncbi:MAG: hypothetical protein ACI3Y8_06570, partial [Candidatus Cryptobacteroides sp.]